MERLLSLLAAESLTKFVRKGGKNIAQFKPITPYAFSHAEHDPAHHLAVDAAALLQVDAPRDARVIAALVADRADVRGDGDMDLQGW